MQCYYKLMGHYWRATLVLGDLGDFYASVIQMVKKKTAAVTEILRGHYNVEDRILV